MAQTELRAELERALSDPRVRAFLDMIAQAEGTEGSLETRGSGYDVLFGGERISSLAQHPARRITHGGLTSTAAGRYQFLLRTWNALCERLHLADFSPHSQDLGALLLLKECGALRLVQIDCPEKAIRAAAHIWASFPGAGYPNQANRSLDWMLARYMQALASYRIGRGNCDKEVVAMNEEKKSISQSKAVTVAGVVISLVSYAAQMPEIQALSPKWAGALLVVGVAAAAAGRALKG
ncbi:MAG TPA: glycoside hydrolase family 104 protein [Chthonomonadales bacterium]|jgi:muramidase (phage lysozyme)|nr:glycoside hydrolase family 104 protein [Chthonomonadales bacterium]